MSGIIVSKYGGSSITKYEDIKRIRKITEDDPRRRVIVVSAPGKRDKSDMKVTDMLIELAKTKDNSLMEKIIDRYKPLSRTGVKEISDLLQQKVRKKLDEAAYLDSIKAFGEEACAWLIGEELGFHYISPSRLLRVSEDYGNARILAESKKMIQKVISDDPNAVVIVPGFFGYTAKHNIATFSRGGSDLTGAYIADALNAKVYENFTDKDGVFAADPALVDSPKKIDIMIYNELRDLSYSGFSIFHDEAIKPVRNRRIPTHIRNTFGYPNEGTWIVHDRLSDPNKPIVGVAYKDGFCSFDIEVFDMNQETGTSADILDVFKKRGISVEYITTGIDDMSIIFSVEQLKGNPNYIGEITNELYSRLHKPEEEQDVEIHFQEHFGSLVVAGKGLKDKKGIFTDISKTLVDADVGIKFVSRGARCIIYVINSSEGKNAVNAIYNKYLRE